MEDTKLKIQRSSLIELTKDYQKIATGDTKNFNGATGYLELWAKYNNQTISSNVTNYSVQLRLVVSNGYIGNYQSTPYSVSADGIGTQNGDNGSANYTSQTLKTITGNVTHNSDGTKNVNMSGSINFTAWGQSLTVSGSAKLPTIPRKSEVACSSVYIGDTATITIDRKSDEFKDTVTYKIEDIIGMLAIKTSDKVLSLKTSSIADQVYALIPNSREIQGTITCNTYNGNTNIGSSNTTFNLYTKESICKPNVSWEIVDTNEKAIAITGDNTKFIKYVSMPKVTVSATPKNSATIKSYSINLNDGQIQNTQEYTFPSIGSDSITVNAIDSRDYGNPQNISLSNKMIDYVQLQINKFELERTEEASNEIILNCNGVWFNGNFTDTKVNTLIASFQYKKSEDEEWTDGGTLTPVIENNTFKISNLSLGTDYDYQSEYQFKIIFSDLIMTIGDLNTDIHVVAKGLETIAVGDLCGWLYGDWKLNDSPLGTGGDTLPIDAIVNYDGTEVPNGYEKVTESSGKTNDWVWKKYSDGTAECFKKFTFTENINNITVSGYRSRTLDLGAYPIEFVKVPVVTMTSYCDYKYSDSVGEQYIFNTQTDKPSLTSCGKVLFFCFKQSSDRTITLDVIVKGTWK